LTFSFKNFNITEFNEAVLHNINFSLLTKKEAEFVRTLFENISLLFNANDLLAKGKLTVSNIIQMLNAMKNYTSGYLSYLIRWVPYNLSVLDTSMVKRIFIMAMPAYYNLGLHLNETLYNSEIIRFHTSVLLLGNSSLTDNPYYDGWLFYIAHKVPLIKVSLPIVASMIIPNRIQVDQRFYVNMTLRLLKDLHYVNITFSYPKEFELLEGNKSISFVDTKAGATFNLSWYLVGLYEGNYTVGALICSEKGNLTLTSIIDVLLPPILPTKTHTLTVKCVDAKGNPVPDHVVLIYNAREGNLVTWNVTNVNGTAIFNDLLEGHYEVKISDGRILNSTLIYLYKDTTVILKVLKYFIRVNVFLDNGVPLEGAAVYIYDVNGSLVFLGYTNKNGTLVKSGLLPGKYDVEVKIGKLSIDKKSIDVTKQHVVDFVVKVYNIGVQALSPEGKPLSGAIVTIRNAENNNLVASYVADALGHVSFTLPRGTYVIIVDKDSYHGKRIVEVANNLNIYIVCHAPERSWILILIAPVLLVTAFVVRYKRLKSMYSEEVKYRRLLKRLNELYKKGLIEERFYIKLKSEYEEKLRELEGGRP
ncbi:MAG: hypothetical protein J7J99_02685, partial [Thermoprotei archaeon]|nr:hypothetical protein [Thermoprotei archaeon]